MTDDWSGYRVRVTRDASWGPAAWKAEVDHKATPKPVDRPDPVGLVADDEGPRFTALGYRRFKPAPGPEPLDLQDVIVDVGTGFAWTRAGAHRRGERIVARDRKRAARAAAAEDRFL